MASASKISSNPFLYHYGSPSKLWDTFRKLVVVNPNSTTGMPLPIANRNPPPASREEHYTPAGTLSSDPAVNPYYARDYRRAYVPVRGVEQEELAKLIVQGDRRVSVPPPALPEAKETETGLVKETSSPSLAALYASTATPASTESATTKAFLPPVPPGRKYKFTKLGADALPRTRPDFEIDNFT
ncbi:hypothetical protein BT69DRAFT_1281149 [Atractiella rhizophila]|nr:hypothetical protein BT69DRAFT_1281149 [Atractiella rhizophila]